MTESEKHKQLKLLGRIMLKDRGYSDEQIFEEYKIELGKKKYIVDICGIKNPKHFDGGESIAVECGTTNSEKLVNLKLFFDEIIVLPYGMTSLDSDLRTTLQEQIDKIEELKKELEAQRQVIGKKDQTIFSLRSHAERYNRVMIIAQVLASENERRVYPYSRNDNKIKAIAAILNDQTLEEFNEENRKERSTKKASARLW